MLAKDVMAEGVLTVTDTATIYEAAEMLVNARVSAMPVLDRSGAMVGIVSEADLIQRVDADMSAPSSGPSSGMLARAAENLASASDFVRSHASRVGDVMTKDVVTADENVVLGEIASLMLKHRIKRVLITRRGRLAGVVSRIDLLKALISHRPTTTTMSATAPSSSAAHAEPSSDDKLRVAVQSALASQSWASAWPADIVVTAGNVHLWGVVPDGSVRDAYRIAIEKVPGVASVEVHMHVVPASLRARRARV